MGIAGDSGMDEYRKRAVVVIGVCPLVGFFCFVCFFGEAIRMNSGLRAQSYCRDWLYIDTVYIRFWSVLKTQAIEDKWQVC